MEMRYEIKFFIDYAGFEDREPTEEEYAGLRVALEDFFFRYIGGKYENNTNTELLRHDLAILDKEYIPIPTEDRYSHRVEFKSDFIFDGLTPAMRDIWGHYDNMSLQQLTEQGVWSANPLYGLFYFTAGILWTQLEEGSTDTASENVSRAYSNNTLV